MSGKKNDQLTLSSVKLLFAVILTVGGVCGTFFGGIEMAKSHADENTRTLRQENNRMVDKIDAKIQNIESNVKYIDEKVDKQTADLKIVRTILEYNFEKGKTIGKNK